MRTNKMSFLSRLTSSENNGRGDYNRLNVNGPSRSRLFGWKRFAIGASIIIFFVLVFGPRHNRKKVYEIGHKWNKPEITQPPSSPENKANQGGTKSPSSTGADTEASRTKHCDKPFKPGQPIVQYALMIDAGSTGSRIHIYKFHNCFAQPTYENEVFKQKRPGLSDYASSPTDAAKSLDELMDAALDAVPSQLRSCTPVAVKATAGLRLLGVKESAEILKAVETRLTSRYPFPLSKKDGVVILDGKDEGIFAFITTNYLMNAFKDSSAERPSTYAVLDLGGASTQIVFQPRAAGPESQLMEGDHKYNLNFAGTNYTLYQHSYLGYGLMEARKSVNRLVQFMSTFNKEPRISEGHGTVNPCFSRGMSKEVPVEDRNITMTGADVGSFDGCRRIIELVMAKDAVCMVKPCSFNGIYQPSILDAFPTGNIMILSYFYDRLSPLLGPAQESQLFPIKRIAEFAEIVCQGSDAWAKQFGLDKNAMSELNDRPEYCLDLTFMYTLLRLGYEFEDNRPVKIAKQIEGTELGWALGAGIALVGAHIECVA